MDRLFLSKETKMPYSMTGFGRAEKIFATRKYSVELKSVNSRYCDLNIRMPRLFNFADAAVRKQITDSLTRGKVDVFINYQDTASESETVTVNEGLVKAYSDAAAKIADVSGRPDDLGVARLASYPDVLQVSQTSVDEDMLGAELAETVAEALDAMKAMRKREGDALAENILGKICTLAGIRDEIEERPRRSSKATGQSSPPGWMSSLLPSRRNSTMRADSRQRWLFSQTSVPWMKS